MEHSLAPDIFYYPNVTIEPTLQALLLKRDGVKPVLNDMVKRHILADIEAINNVDVSRPRRVEDYVIVGDCLKPFYQSKKDVPIEVVVMYNTNDFSDLMHSRLDHLLSVIQDRLLPGTNRKVHYYIRHTSIDLSKYLAVYHPFTDKWLKEANTYNINA